VMVVHEHGNDPWGSIQREELLENRSDYRITKEDTARLHKVVGLR
jgi:hypothetical protein